jgi:hypothetical protein
MFRSVMASLIKGFIQLFQRDFSVGHVFGGSFQAGTLHVILRMSSRAIKTILCFGGL